MSELARHINHRCILIDSTRLKCVDCTRTILLPTSPGTTSTSSAISGPDDPRCPHHATEHANGCRTCTADRKATRTSTPAKPLAGWAARSADSPHRLPPGG